MKWIDRHSSRRSCVSTYELARCLSWRDGEDVNYLPVGTRFEGPVRDTGLPYCDKSEWVGCGGGRSFRRFLISLPN